METTSTIVSLGAIIEMAVRPFRVDRDSVVTYIRPVHSWREDPGVPLTSETTAITGLTDADVSGEQIDEAEAARLLRSASLVVAHHATFDRPYVERGSEEARGLHWACSFRQVDWHARGFNGRTLGYLLHQTSYFYKGHRAAVDVDALIQMLRVRGDSSTPVLPELIANAEAPSWAMYAQGAAFESKDVLQACRYRRDAEHLCLREEDEVRVRARHARV